MELVKNKTSVQLKMRQKLRRFFFTVMLTKKEKNNSERDGEKSMKKQDQKLWKQKRKTKYLGRVLLIGYEEGGVAVKKMNKHRNIQKNYIVYFSLSYDSRE